MHKLIYLSLNQSKRKILMFLKSKEVKIMINQNFWTNLLIQIMGKSRQNLHKVMKNLLLIHKKEKVTLNKM